MPQGSPYSEDMLSSKKLAVGFDFKSAKIAKTSPWATQFNKVTPDALLLFAQSTNAAWRKQQMELRKRMTKREAEERLECCCLAA